MDYVEYLMNFLPEDICEIIDEYLSPYCTICGRTYLDINNVRVVHDGEYEYNECVDKTNCILVEEKKTKYNPWSSTRGR